MTKNRAVDRTNNTGCDRSTDVVDVEASLPSEACSSTSKSGVISSTTGDVGVGDKSLKSAITTVSASSVSIVSKATTTTTATQDQEQPIKKKTTIHLTPTSSKTPSTHYHNSSSSSPTPNMNNTTSTTNANRRSPLDLTLTSLFTSGNASVMSRSTMTESKNNPYSDYKETSHRPTSVMKGIDETSCGGITSVGGFQISEISVPHGQQQHEQGSHNNQCTNDDFTVIHMEDESTHAAPTVYKEDPMHTLKREEAKIRESRRRQMWMCLAMVAFLMIAGLSAALGILIVRGGSGGNDDKMELQGVNTNNFDSNNNNNIPTTGGGSGGGGDEKDDGRLGDMDDSNGSTSSNNGNGSSGTDPEPDDTNVGNGSSTTETPEQREVAIYNIISRISNPSSLQDGTNNNKKTSQRRAYEWIVYDDPKQVSSYNVNEIISRYVLTVLFYSLNGSNWFSNGRWLSSSDVCQWMGITCANTDSTKIIKLDLANLNLSGDLPPELGQLTHLESLELQQNWFLKGTLPSTIGNLIYLKEFTMYSTTVGGPLPDSIGNCLDLRTLNLEGNQLTNQLPSTLGNLYQLEALNLSYNNFTGSMSSNTFSGLIALKTLRLEGNNFDSGTTLPSSVCQLPYLTNIGRDCSVQCDCCTTSNSCV